MEMWKYGSMEVWKCGSIEGWKPEGWRGEGWKCGSGTSSYPRVYPTRSRCCVHYCAVQLTLCAMGLNGLAESLTALDSSTPAQAYH